MPKINTNDLGYHDTISPESCKSPPLPPRNRHRRLSSEFFEHATNIRDQEELEDKIMEEIEKDCFKIALEALSGCFKFRR